MLLKILDTPAGEKFVAQTASYRQYMKENVERYPDLIRHIEETSADTGEMKSYNVHMRSGFRQLEYSFVLDHIPKNRQQRILDMGSGVTIFPQTLARSGHIVDAMDPSPNWRLRDPRVQACFNTFYGTDVRYLHQYAEEITGKGMYDIITSVSVFEHLYRRQVSATIRHLITLLKPGGRFIFTVDYAPFPTQKPRRLREHIYWLRNQLTRLTYDEAFTQAEVVSHLLQNLPGKADLGSLRERSRHATPYQDFWSSHMFEGCLHDGNMQYLPLAVCCTVPEE
jgi:2-polyprenyl-3-methyl-5-hydroxy-6-metoxy-1,4-benzoquinol methylase